MSTYFPSDVNYYEYIRSEAWRTKANAAKKRAGYRCQVCNKHSKEVQLDAHHRTYERLGQEIPDDITVLCRDCHSLYENNRKLNKLPTKGNKPLPVYQSLSHSLPAQEKSFPSYRPQLHRTRSTDRSLPVYQPPSDHAHEFATVGPNETGNAAQPQPTAVQEEIDPPTPAEVGHFDDLFDSNIHLLSKLGVWIYVLGVIGHALFVLSAEAVLLMNDPLSIINPVAHYQIIVMTLTSPIFWQTMTVVIGGLALTGLGNSLVNFTQPKYSALRWFWQWKGTALVKIPVFLFAWATIFYGAISVFSSILIVISENIGILKFPLILPILRLYAGYLLIPIVHLIWDNRFRDGWRKLAITIMYLIVWGVASFFIEVTWSRTLCANQLNTSISCNFFAEAPAPVEIIERKNQLDSLSDPLKETDELDLDSLLATLEDPSTDDKLRSPDAPSYLRIAADMIHEQGASEGNIAYWDRMIAESRETDDPVSGKGAFTIKAMLYRAQGEYEKSLDTYHEAYSIYRQHDNIALQASILQDIGETYQEIGRYPEAIEAYNQALALRRQAHGEQKNTAIAKILYSLGTIHGGREEYAQALHYFNLTLPIAQNLQEYGYELSLHFNIGTIHMENEQSHEALASFQQAHTLSLEVNSRAAEASSLNWIGSVYWNLENTSQSLIHFEQALPITREIGDYEGESVALLGLGVVHNKMGDLESAYSASKTSSRVRRICSRISSVDLPFRSLGGRF